MKSALLSAAALLIASTIAGSVPARAQGAPQTLTTLNVTSVATGYRASKIIGSSIVNDANEKIGSVDDLIISRSDRVPYAIVSVGGFLGMGDKLVAVPMEQLQITMDHTVLAGATKDLLKAMPAFKYAR